MSISEEVRVVSSEAEALIRSLLFTALKDESYESVLFQIKSMCSKDDIAAVEHEINEYRKRIEEKQDK